MRKTKDIIYPFSDEIVFPIVMQDPEKCRIFLERLFPGKIVSDLHLKGQPLFPSKATSEKTIITGLSSRGIRLDVLFEGEDAWYDIEMQVKRRRDLPKRTRYYHSLMDQAYLKTSEPYAKLNPQYVIFICAFDPFSYGKSLYKFSMSEEDIGLKLGDESFTIFLNTKADRACVPDELRSFYEYIDKHIVDDADDFITSIHNRVVELNDDREWRDSLMTIGDLMDERYEEGQSEMLLTLVRSGKLAYEDALAASDNPEVFEEMYRTAKE